MNITIANLLQLDQFDNVEVIAGMEGLNNKVENIYFMEVPDIYSFIDKNGLLLTTLFPIADNEEAIKFLIPQLVEFGLAGVAIKSGRYIDKIPDIMIEQANRYQFPLLQLPDNANLSTLTIQVLSMLLGTKVSKLEFRDRMHRQLLDLLLEGADLKRFLLSVSEIISVPVIVIDNELQYVETSINTAENKVIITKNSGHAHNYISSVRDILITISDRQFRYEDLLIQPIFAGKESLGYVIALIKQTNNLSDNLTVTIEQASILLAVLFQTERAMLQKERNYLDNFIRDVFSGSYQSQTEVMEKAKIFKWEFHFPATIINIKTSLNDSNEKLAHYYRMLDSRLIESIISEAVDIPINNCKVFYYNDAVVCIISIAFERRLKERLQKVAKMIIANFAKEAHLAVTISNTFYNLNQIKGAYENALLAYSVFANKLTTESFVQFYDELGLFKLFHLIDDQSQLQQFVDDKLGSIIELDEQKDTKMMETINYFIKNNGNLQKTADEMFIHYNTLRYRINKLKQLGIDIEDGLAVTELATAYQIYEYLQSR